MGITFGKKLIHHPLVIRDLLDMEVYLEGAMMLAIKAADVFRKSYFLVDTADKPGQDCLYRIA